MPHKHMFWTILLVYFIRVVGTQFPREPPLVMCLFQATQEGLFQVRRHLG